MQWHCMPLYKWSALLEIKGTLLFMTFSIVLLQCEHLAATTGLERLLCLSGMLEIRHGTLTHTDKCPTAPTL